MKTKHFMLLCAAMLSISVSVLTGCKDSEPTPDKKMKVSVISTYLVPRMSCPLSDSTYASINTCMTNAQKNLGTMDYTNPANAKTLMHNTIKTEVNKLSNGMRYELKSNKFDIYLNCSNVTPVICDTFNTREIEATAPVVVYNIDSVVVNTEFVNTTNLSKANVDSIKAAATYANQKLAGDTVHTTQSDVNDAVGDKVLNVIKAKYPNLTTLSEYAIGTNKYQIIIAAPYSIKGQQQIPWCKLTWNSFATK